MNLFSLLLVFPVSLAKSHDRDYEEFKLRHIIDGKAASAAYQRSVGEVSVSSAINLMQGAPKEISRLPGLKVKVQPGSELLFQQSLSGYYSQTSADDLMPQWLPQPDNFDTIRSFALMSANSYEKRMLEQWRSLPDDWTDKDSFGWGGTGLRGHVFANRAETIIVIALKGTSTLLHGGETVARDKYMDNIMFSCCCAHVDITWTPVCGCYLGGGGEGKRCNVTCLKETIREDDDSYYHTALAVTHVVLARYPRAHLWFTGHSLGGALAALMAATVRRSAAITFASPGALKYARLLEKGLNDSRPSWQLPIWNYGLSSDPIFMGTCTGLGTSCYLSGYAMETRCRHGHDCMYAISSWQPDVSTHRIDWLIDNILAKPEKYPLPSCMPVLNCTDCEQWTFNETTY